MRAGHGYMGDHHEFQLTPRGTAYMSVYAPRSADLRAVGGRRDGTIFESIVQEVDVASGRVVWEWHSADHLPVSEGVTPPKADKPHDYFHVNAVDEDRGGRPADQRAQHARDLRGRQAHRPRAVAARRHAQRLRARRRARTSTSSTTSQLPASRHGPRCRCSTTRRRRRPPSSRAGSCCALDLRAENGARRARSTRTRTGCCRSPRATCRRCPTGTSSSAGGRSATSRSSARAAACCSTSSCRREPTATRRSASPGAASRSTARRSRRAATPSPDRLTVWASWNGATELRGWQLLAGDDADDAASARRTGRHARLRDDALHARSRAHARSPCARSTRTAESSPSRARSSRRQLASSAQ